MNRYLLDTSVYGILVDEHEQDHEVVKKIIDYAKRNRDYFVTTFIISQELNAEEISDRIKNIIYPNTMPPYPVILR